MPGDDRVQGDRLQARRPEAAGLARGPVRAAGRRHASLAPLPRRARGGCAGRRGARRREHAPPSPGERPGLIGEGRGEAPPVRYHCADGEPHRADRDSLSPRVRNPVALRGVLRRARPHRRPQRQPRPGGRPDAAVHELGHGPVQGRADRGGEARLRPRGRLPALPAGRRQAQRLRGGRPDAAPPHAVRDARQLELRRLLQARGDPLGVGLPDPRPPDPRRPARRHRLHHRRPGPLGLEGRDRPAAGASRALGRLPGRRREELVAHGRRRALRPLLGAPLRPRRAPVRGPGVRPGPQRALPALARGLEPRVHGVRAPPGPLADAAAGAGRGHGPGPRAGRERRAGRGEQLRHRPVRPDPRPDARAAGPRSRGLRGGALQLPGDRGPLARGDVPRGRRGPALERGPGLRPAPDPPPGGPPRPAARADRAVPRRDGQGRHRDDGRRVPPPRRARVPRSWA